MERIRDYAELRRLCDEHRGRIDFRNGTPDGAPYPSGDRKEILVCADTGCKSSGCRKLMEALARELNSRGENQRVMVVPTGCFGFCEMGPILKTFPGGIFYVKVREEHIPAILDALLEDKAPPRECLYPPGEDAEPILYQQEIPFYRMQSRIVLKNCGVIDPSSLEDYMGAGGYLALGRVLFEMSPEEVVNCVREAGLRGRGGGGFPTGIKWEVAARQDSLEKYVICNADEGDPGAFMDRSILEGDPHRILEAMTIAGYATGAGQGFIYIRAEYPHAVARLRTALDQAREWGLLGDNILNSGFSFEIALKLGAGAFVCGEETALIHSAEGRRGEPTVKPPFPAEKGMHGRPTVINNVETLGNIPGIILEGPEWFRQLGTERSPGTKVFALAGKIQNGGLIEVPMGITLREIIYGIGGGIRSGREFKAVQTGGPSGGCITKENLDISIDYESLKAAGSMMGSGGMIVMDSDNCMVDVAAFYTGFVVEESCGKCTPCRVGNMRMLELLHKVSTHQGEEKDLEDLKALAHLIRKTALCGLGQTAPNPVLSTLENFPEEYLAHARDHQCPAKVCINLIEYRIKDTCTGCTLCRKVCPAGAISGHRKEQHTIDPVACIRCGLCLNRCPSGSILVV